ncbi:MAG: hypothetical protein AAF724_12995 [Pseudomonadota bacterium]
MRKSVVKAMTAAGILLATVPTAFSQVPTEAQKQALRSNCVSDFRANCAGVPTGGMDALVCLEQHEDKLSSACKSAVEAVGHGSSPTGSSAAATQSAPASASESGASAAAEGAASAASESARSADQQEITSAPASEAAAAATRRPMSLRQEIRIAARSCEHDYRVLCPNLPVGQGNILFCLKVHANRLSTPCRNALLEAGESF